MGDPWRLMNHQKYAVGLASANPAVGYAYDMGTGKTFIALMNAYRLVRDEDIRNILIICPASLVGNWYEKTDLLINFSEEVTPEGLAKLKSRMYVTSYQKMYKHGAKPNKLTAVIPLRPEVDKLWDLLMIDESHNIGSHSSSQTYAAYNLALRSARRYLFTGTPVHGGGGQEDFSKLFGQVRVLDPPRWKYWKDFLEECVIATDKYHKPIAYDVPKCREILMEYFDVCRITDVIDMPEMQDIVIDCPLVETKIYEDLKDGAVEEYDINPETAGMFYNKSLQLCSGHLITDSGKLHLRSSKDEILLELINSTDDKVVIFCKFTESTERCKEICRKAGRTVTTIDGKTKDKQKEVNKFQSGACNAIICQYFSGNEGLDLYTSHTTIFFEPQPRAGVYSQARARIYRNGQKNNCLYYILRTPYTLEAKAWDTVRSGEDVTRDMMDKWSRDELKIDINR